MRLSKLAGAQLTHPDVELSGLVGEEGDEPAVGRDFGVLFRALPIRDARERGVGERVLLAVVAGRRASHAPTATASAASATHGSHVVRLFGASARHRSSVAPGSTSSIASISIRTSPISLRRCFGSFARQRSRSRRIGRRRRGGQRRPVRLALEDLRDRVRDRVARET